MLMGDPCPGEPGASGYAIAHTNLYYTLLLGIGIEESEHFGPTDLTE